MGGVFEAADEVEAESSDQAANLKPAARRGQCPDLTLDVQIGQRLVKDAKAALPENEILFVDHSQTYDELVCRWIIVHGLAELRFRDNLHVRFRAESRAMRSHVAEKGPHALCELNSPLARDPVTGELEQ